MSNPSPLDLNSVAVTLVVVVIVMVIIIHLVPVLLQMTWQLLPGVLLLWLIAVVLRSMMTKLLK